MAVTRQQIVNALNMYLDDYVTDDDNIEAEELDNVKKHFDKMLGDLREECEEPESDDDDDEELDEDPDEEP